MCWHRVTSHRILSSLLITFDLQLQACVGRRMTWRDTTLYAIALFGANFSMEENLPHRQKIWRAMWDSDLRWTWSNLLLLFCGIYRTSLPFSFLCVAAPLLFFCWAVTHRETCFSQFLWRKIRVNKMLKLVWRRKTEANKSREFFSRKNGGSSRWSGTAEGEKSSLCVNTLTRVEWTRYTSTLVWSSQLWRSLKMHTEEKAAKANWKLLQVFLSFSLHQLTCRWFFLCVYLHYRRA